MRYRYSLGLCLIGFVLGVIFLPGGVGSALTCSDIEKTYSYYTSFCQQLLGVDDYSENKYKNNHATDDITLGFLVADSGPNYEENPPEVITENYDFVEHLTTSKIFNVGGVRDDQCEETGNWWITKVSLGGSPVCDNTAHTFTFSENCCD